MKDLSQQEFEAHIERLLSGEIGRKALAKELNTDIGTLTRKIVELSVTNPELYLRWVEKFPYRPKNTNIKEEELAIAIINDGLQQTIERLRISKMTVSRKIRKLKDINPELYWLYTHRNCDMTKIEREQFWMQVEKYNEGYTTVQRTDIEDTKRAIEEEIRIITELMRKQLRIEEAARVLGRKNSEEIWRRCRLLERILTEERAKEELENRKNNKEQDFKKSLKYNVKLQQFQNTDSDSKKRQKEIEDDGR